MPKPDYDVAIVGARCAGATLATFLARAGARVVGRSYETHARSARCAAP